MHIILTYIIHFAYEVCIQGLRITWFDRLIFNVVKGNKEKYDSQYTNKVGLNVGCEMFNFWVCNRFSFAVGGMEY